jgi:hypothetical protein
MTMTRKITRHRLDFMRTFIGGAPNNDFRRKKVMNRLLIIQSKLVAPKSQYNDFGKFKYRNVEDLLGALKPLLWETQTVLVCSDVIEMIGTRYYVKTQAELKGVDGNRIDYAYGYAREEETKKGMDGSQITGSAATYSKKRAIENLFSCDDSKDADSMAKPSDGPPHPKQPPAAAKQPSAVGDPQDLRTEIRKMLLEMGGGEKVEAVRLLEELTTFTGRDGNPVPGKSSVNDLSDKHARVCYGKTKDRYEQWMAEMEAPPPEEIEDEINLFDPGPDDGDNFPF